MSSPDPRCVPRVGSRSSSAGAGVRVCGVVSTAATVSPTTLLLRRAHDGNGCGRSGARSSGRSAARRSKSVVGETVAAVGRRRETRALRGGDAARGRNRRERRGSGDCDDATHARRRRDARARVPRSRRSASSLERADRHGRTSRSRSLARWRQPSSPRQPSPSVSRRPNRSRTGRSRREVSSSGIPATSHPHSPDSVSGKTYFEPHSAS